MLSRSRPRTRGGHASHIDGSKRGAWAARREWQAALALLVDMARLQGQVDVMEQAGRRSGEARAPAMHAQLREAIPVVVLQPLTSEARWSVPEYHGPMQLVVAQEAARRILEEK